MGPLFPVSGCVSMSVAAFNASSVAYHTTPEGSALCLFRRVCSRKGSVRARSGALTRLKHDQRGKDPCDPNPGISDAGAYCRSQHEQQGQGIL